MMDVRVILLDKKSNSQESFGFMLYKDKTIKEEHISNEMKKFVLSSCLQLFSSIVKSSIKKSQCKKVCNDVCISSFFNFISIFG